MVHLLETGAVDGGVEVDTFEEVIDLEVGVGGGGEGPLRTLTGSAETAEGALVLLEVLALLALELLAEEVDHAVVEIFAAKGSVTSGGLDYEDAFLDGEEGDIEGGATKVEDEHVALTAPLDIKAVGNGRTNT
jgi:hypothetical protein